MLLYCKVLIAVLAVVVGFTATATAAEYPYADMPCIHAPYGVAGKGNKWCAHYDWGLQRNVAAARSTISPYGYAYRNCTDYAAWRLDNMGVSPRDYTGLGHAKTWASRAQARGILVDTVPLPGAIGVKPAGEYGHVVVVESVDDNGWLTVAQYNKQGTGVFSLSYGTPTQLGLTAFIHFELPSPPVVSADPVPSVPAVAAAPSSELLLPVAEEPVVQPPTPVAAVLPTAEAAVDATQDPGQAPPIFRPSQIALSPEPTPPPWVLLAPTTVGDQQVPLFAKSTCKIAYCCSDACSAYYQLHNEQETIRMNPTQQPYNAAPPPQPPAVPAPQQYQAQQQQMLAQVVNNAQEMLYEANTVFPFTWFVDSVTMDREKITITRRSFFKTGEVTSLLIDDILNVNAHVGPFLGSLKVQLRNVNQQQQPEEIHYLKRKDALALAHIAQGYMLARQQGVDCAALPKGQLVKMLEDLGSGVVPGNAAP